MARGIGVVSQSETSPKKKFDYKNLNPDEIWGDLHTGIKEIYSGESMPMPRYMKLYTHVYNYCTTVADTQNLKESQNGTKIAQTVGHQLYQRIEKFLRDHQDALLVDSADLMGEAVLQFY